jgi:hypothetical protein
VQIPICIWHLQYLRSQVWWYIFIQFCFQFIEISPRIFIRGRRDEGFTFTKDIHFNWWLSVRLLKLSLFTKFLKNWHSFCQRVSVLGVNDISGSFYFTGLCIEFLSTRPQQNIITCVFAVTQSHQFWLPMTSGLVKFILLSTLWPLQIFLNRYLLLFLVAVSGECRGRCHWLINEFWWNLCCFNAFSIGAIFWVFKTLRLLLHRLI